MSAVVGVLSCVHCAMSCVSEGGAGSIDVRPGIACRLRRVLHFFSLRISLLRLSSFH